MSSTTQRTAATDALEQLARPWQQEAAAARARAEAERAGHGLAERVEAGVALDQLAVADLFAVPGPRIGLRLESDREGAIAASRLRPGDPVLLWRRSPDEREAVRGVVGRRGGRRLDVVVDEAFADAFDAPGFRLDSDAPDVTVARGAAALRRAVEGRPGTLLGKLCEALWGSGEGVFPASPPSVASADASGLSFRDVALQPRQQRAVVHALAAHPLALVHGPPGTGKTRVLVEVVRQALGRGERVPCAAASHAAVDHLVAKRGEVGVDVLRIGHPARLDPGTVDCSLDARLEASAAAPMAAKWVAEARKIFAKMDSKRARGSLGRDDRRHPQPPRAPRAPRRCALETRSTRRRSGSLSGRGRRGRASRTAPLGVRGRRARSERTRGATKKYRPDMAWSRLLRRLHAPVGDEPSGLLARARSASPSWPSRSGSANALK